MGSDLPDIAHTNAIFCQYHYKLVICILSIKIFVLTTPSQGMFVSCATLPKQHCEVVFKLKIAVEKFQ